MNDGQAFVGPFSPRPGSDFVVGTVSLRFNVQEIDARGNLVVVGLRVATPLGVTDLLVATAGAHDCEHPEPAAAPATIAVLERLRGLA